MVLLKVESITIKNILLQKRTRACDTIQSFSRLNLSDNDFNKKGFCETESVSFRKTIAEKNISYVYENTKVHPQHCGQPMINYGSKKQIAQ